MGYRTRSYVKGDDPMYRAVTPYAEHRWNPDTRASEPTGRTLYRYAGPYTTEGAAKRQRGPGGWVEVILRPAWEKLEE